MFTSHARQWNSNNLFGNLILLLGRHINNPLRKNVFKSLYKFWKNNKNSINIAYSCPYEFTNMICEILPEDKEIIAVLESNGKRPLSRIRTYAALINNDKDKMAAELFSDNYQKIDINSVSGYIYNAPDLCGKLDKFLTMLKPDLNLPRTSVFRFHAICYNKK